MFSCFDIYLAQSNIKVMSRTYVTSSFEFWVTVLKVASRFILFQSTSIDYDLCGELMTEWDDDWYIARTPLLMKCIGKR